jgi:hypothetical protein
MWLAPFAQLVSSPFYWRAARQDFLEFRVRTCDILEMTVTFEG